MLTVFKSYAATLVLDRSIRRYLCVLYCTVPLTNTNTNTSFCDLPLLSLSLLSGEYRYFVLLDPVQDIYGIYVGDPLCPYVYMNVWSSHIARVWINQVRLTILLVVS